MPSSVSYIYINIKLPKIHWVWVLSTTNGKNKNIVLPVSYVLHIEYILGFRGIIYRRQRGYKVFMYGMYCGVRMAIEVIHIYFCGWKNQKKQLRDRYHWFTSSDRNWNCFILNHMHFNIPSLKKILQWLLTSDC